MQDDKQISQNAQHRQTTKRDWHKPTFSISSIHTDTQANPGMGADGGTSPFTQAS